MGVVGKKHKTEFKNLNFKINKSSGTVQIYPRVPLKKLYFKSHGAGKIGQVWSEHHKEFFQFTKKYLNKKILEIGGGHNSISNMFDNLKGGTSPTTTITTESNQNNVETFLENPYAVASVGLFLIYTGFWGFYAACNIPIYDLGPEYGMEGVKEHKLAPYELAVQHRKIKSVYQKILLVK